MILKKPLLHQDLTKLKEEIYVKPSNNKRIIEIILEIRLSLLKGDMDNRKTLIKWLIEVDFLKVKENEDFETIIDLISLNDHSLTTCLISLISMICSSLDGVYYVTSSFQKNSIIKKIFLVFLKK